MLIWQLACQRKFKFIERYYPTSVKIENSTPALDPGPIHIQNWLWILLQQNRRLWSESTPALRPIPWSPLVRRNVE